MPFRSVKQRKYLFMAHPDLANRWAKEYGSAIVPSKKKPRVFRPRSK
jgi:hypothetical protein